LWAVSDFSYRAFFHEHSLKETKKKGAAAVRVFIIRFEKYSRGSPKQQDCNRSYHKKPSAVAEVSTIQRQEREVISSLSLITHTTNTNENYGTTMKLSTRRSTAKATSSSLLSSTTKYDTENVSHQNQGDEQTSLFASECQRLYEINLLDFIRGDSHLPERYVFDTDLFPDYSRVTQRRLVDVIQTVCQAQQSPISVHQWANEEHDDRIVRRIRFRCAFFRKKKRFADRKSCGFQFQVCYQQKYGWCLLNGKGHAQHEGHSLPAPEVAPELLKKNNNNQNRKPAAVPSCKKTSPAAVAATVASPKKLYVPPPLSKGEGAAATATPACVPCCASTTCSSTACSSNSSTSTAGMSPQHYFPNFPDENDDILAENAAWKDLKETSDSKMTPAYIDFALDPIHHMDMDGDEAMNWDLLDEDEPLGATSVPESGAGGLLHKTIHLAEPPFPEVTDLEDKVAGIMEALRSYAEAHNFVLTVEDLDTVDRPGEKTIRVVLHCLGSGCCYQVALLWVVGLTRWNVYCQPDGIFVHGCSRLEKQGAACACAATPVNQALEHLDDFLNGEVVCPDEGNDIPTVVAAAKWGPEKKVSENVRKETRKAVAKVAGVDATASAA